MIFPRGKSILRLVAIGFIVVTAPLILAVIAAAVEVEQLAEQYRRAVSTAETAIHQASAVSEHLTAMERSLGQFMILDDPALYKAYLDRRQAFLLAAANLERSDLEEPLRVRLRTVVGEERGLHARVVQSPPGFASVGELSSAFATITNDSNRLLPESRREIETAANKMKDAAGNLQRLLIMLSATLIPSSIGLALVFTVLITRPLAAIRGAISRLGAGDFASAVEIEGPHDLMELGKQLDWLRRRVVELESQKMNFLRQTSHDLKTPLSSIREGVELLNEGAHRRVDPGEVAEIIRIIRDSAVKLQELIEDLMQFGRTAPASANGLSGPVRVEIVPLITDVVHKHTLQMAAKDLRVRLELSEMTVRADPAQLATVVDNLVSNAVKYSPPAGLITISAHKHGATSTAVVDVLDDGPGIDCDEREHVFDPYYQGRTADQGRVPGTGLGLTIAKRVLEAHGGTIEILESSRGAHIRARLPLGR